MRNSSLLTLLSLTFFLLCATLVTLTGCGGGGGSSSGDSGDTTTSNGVTTTTGTATTTTVVNGSAAVINGDNADEIATNAYDSIAANMFSGETISGLLAGALTSQRRASGPLGLALPGIAAKVMDTVGLGNGVMASVQPQETTSVSGSCGGSMVVTYDIDVSTLSTNLTANYSNYCEGGSITDGLMEMVYSMSGDEVSVSVTFTDFKVTEANGNYSIMNGNMTVTQNETAGTSSSTTTMSVYDSVSGTTNVIQDLTTTVSGLNGPVMYYTVDGTFVDQTYGSTTIATTTPFAANVSDGEPFEGVLLISGDQGTKCRMTLLSTTTYRVEADTNGDGNWDYDSGVQTLD